MEQFVNFSMGRSITYYFLDFEEDDVRLLAQNISLWSTPHLFPFYGLFSLPDLPQRVFVINVDAGIEKISGWWDRCAAIAAPMISRADFDLFCTGFLNSPGAAAQQAFDVILVKRSLLSSQWMPGLLFATLSHETIHLFEQYRCDNQTFCALLPPEDARPGYKAALLYNLAAAVAALPQPPDANAVQYLNHSRDYMEYEEEMLTTAVELTVMAMLGGHDLEALRPVFEADLDAAIAILRDNGLLPRPAPAVQRVER